MEIIAWPGAGELKIGDEVKTLEWLPGEDADQARVRIGETEYAVFFQAVDDHQVLLQVGGRTDPGLRSRGSEREIRVYRGGRLPG